jgi:hypothetical protein
VVPRPIQEAKERAKASQGKRTDLTSSSCGDDVGRSSERIGKNLGMSAATVQRVDRLEREAPEEVERVALGEKSVTQLWR